MSKFKVGQRVKCIAPCGVGKVVEVGKTYAVTGVNARGLAGCTWKLVLDNEICTDFADNFELATPTLDSLSVGDVVVDQGGGKRKVLATVGELVAVSGADDNQHLTAFWLTPTYMKELGYTVKAEPAEPKLTELTLEEIAAKFNVPVEQVRIKEAE